MERKLYVRTYLQSPLCILLHLAIFLTFAIGGCSSKDTTPVQTSGDAIDQYLQENPEEAYSSDGAESDETKEDGEEE
jgi:hypothetical protein